MSWDLDAYVEVDGNTITVGDWNYTHNCNGMVRAAGVPDWLHWDDGISSPDLAAKLATAITAMEANPAKFQEMNPSNGWGSYDTLLPVLREIYAKALEFPSARWTVSR